MTREEIEQAADKTEKLHMKLGQNIGEILLEIAQTAIQKGNPGKAIKTYEDSLKGFTEEYIVKLLKNECVLIVADDKVYVELTDSEVERSINQKNICDWDGWLRLRLESIMETVKFLNTMRDEFIQNTHSSILDYNIIKHANLEKAEELGIHHIVAKLIAGGHFPNLCSNGENLWDNLCTEVESGNPEKYQKALYLIVKYTDCIRTLHKEYACFSKSSAFLIRTGLAEKPRFLEYSLESVLEILCNFTDTNKGYYHPLCNTKLCEYKEAIDDDILSTKFGKEYRRYGILEKNIMDGYDAGWLSPDGKFYGENGTTSNMIHLRIAEKLSGGNIDGDRKLEKTGWIKIHGNEVYGTFIGNLTPKKDFPYSYCPTDIQIKIVCDYIDKYYNGKLYTQPQIVQVTRPITTYKVRQMDNIKLHELFAL